MPTVRQYSLRWYFVALKFCFNIVIKISVSFVTANDQTPEAPLEFLPIEKMMNSNAAARCLG